MRLGTSRCCFLSLFSGLLFWAAAERATALAGGREQALVDFMEKLRVEEYEHDRERFDALQDAVQASGEDGDQKLASIALGVHYLPSNHKLALEYLASAEKSCREQDQLLPIVRFYLASARYRAGSFKEAAAMAESLLQSDLGDNWKRGVYALLLDSLQESGDLDKLLTVYQEYARRYQYHRRDERHARYAVEAYEKRGKLDQAIDQLEQMAENYPATEDARWAFQKLVDWSCDKPRGARPRYAFSRRLLTSISRNAVLNFGLREFIVAQTSVPLEVAPGQIRLMTASERADLFFRARFYDEAYAETLKIYDAEQAVKGSKRLPFVLFELGRINLRRGDMMLASRYFAQFIAAYPKHQQLANAQEYLGDAFKYLGMPGLAARQYADAASTAKDKLTRFEQFWNSYRGGDLPGALKMLETPHYLVPRRGDAPELLTYWHARILEKLGRKAEAEQKFRQILDTGADGYYATLVAAQYPELVKGAGQVAVAKTDAPMPAFRAVTTRESSRYAAPGRKGLSAKLLSPQERNPTIASDLRVVDELARVGMLDAAENQLSDLKWSDYVGRQDAFEAVSRLAWSIEDYQTARRIRFAGFSSLRTVPSNWFDFLRHQATNADEWRLHYPLAFDRILATLADKIKVDKLFVLSIMRAESWYTKDARSQVGARGLMQLMPYTAIRIARQLNDGAFDVQDLERPEVNISYGSYYLDKLVRYYGGNQFAAAAAYNGGPVVVNRWIEACKSCTTEEFVESIPYRETRRYVREVMKNYAQYARLYNGEATFKTLPKLPERFPEGEEIF